MTEPTTFRIDKEIKAEAYAILKDIGLKPSQAVNLFLRQIAIRRGLPFDLQAKVPNAETIAAFKELEHPENLPHYENFKDLLKTLEDEA